MYGFPSKLAALQVRPSSFFLSPVVRRVRADFAVLFRSLSSNGAGSILFVLLQLPDISSFHLTRLDLSFPGEVSPPSPSSRNRSRCSRSQESSHLHHRQTGSPSTSLPSEQELQSSRVQGRRRSKDAHALALQSTSSSRSTLLDDGGERLEEGWRAGGCSELEQAYDCGEYVWRS